MDALDALWVALPRFVPFLFVAAAVSGGLALANWLLLRRRSELGNERRAPRQLALLALTAVAAVVLLIALPVTEATRGQLLGLLGLLLTAIIALSSTTFVANTMAGVMLRLVKNFRPGDFVRIGDHFGRVTERGLFHTEIQTESRDLTTLPNLYLISNPVTVTRSSGTIVSCTLSLGYDLSHTRVLPLLVQAGERAGLADPFVRVLELEDFAVTYRVSGFLEDVKSLLSKRSELRRRVLETLHEQGIEIASPELRIERVIAPSEKLVPKVIVGEDVDEEDRAADIMFDKADRAETAEMLRQTRLELFNRLHEWEEQKKDAEGVVAEKLTKRIEAGQRRLELLDGRIKTLESADD